MTKESKSNLLAVNNADVLMSNGMRLRVTESSDNRLDISLKTQAALTPLISIQRESGICVRGVSYKLISEMTAGFVFDRQSVPDKSFTVKTAQSSKKELEKRHRPTLAVLSKLSEESYNWAKLTDSEIVALAIISFDELNSTIAGFVRAFNKLPWELEARRAVIVWQHVCRTFEMLLGTPVDSALSGLEESEIEKIREEYGNPANNVEEY